MNVVKSNVYQRNPESGVSNEYHTPELSFRQPCLHYIAAVRNSGKSYLASKILAQAKKDKTFDIIYIITPSFSSNKAYFGKYIDEQHVFEPTSDSVVKVIQKVEEDRDEWEQFLKDKKEYEKYMREMKGNPGDVISDDNLMYYWVRGFLDGKKPKWKYEKEEPPKSCLIMDDILSSPAILQSSGLTRLATLNRHIAPLKEESHGRSSCGLAVIILSQSYRMQSGISRVLRENLSLLTLFANKQEKQIQAIKEELGSIEETEFDIAYNMATTERYGNLTIDFNPKKPEYKFRKNLNEFLVAK